MSGYHQLFIQTQVPEGDVVRAVESASDIAVEKLPSIADSAIYGGRSADTVLEMEFDHGLENDRDIEFEMYPIVVTVRNIDSDKQREASMARTLFESLQRLTDYRMLLVFDLQELLAKN